MMMFRTCEGFKKALLSGAALSAIGFSSPCAIAEDKINFDIKPQSLASALDAFGVQAHRPILFTPALAADKATSGVSGVFNADAALTKLLAGTGLMFNDASGTILIEQGTAGTPGSETPSRPTRLGDATQASPSKTEEKPPVEEIVVTGTHIAGVTPASPTVVVDRTDIIRNGYTTVGEALQALPENFAGGKNPTNIGGGGSSGGEYITGDSSANLRGLGANSTLTLVDGHRLAFTQDGAATDLSIIPLIAVKRIEIATDGASALYGADAVGGVVNTILRTNYDGAETSLQLGPTSDGGGLSQQYGQLLGKSWDTGNVTFAYEHANLQPILSSERSFSPITTHPSDLAPDQNRNSYFLSANQALFSGVTAYVEGLYTSRQNTTLTSSSNSETMDTGRTDEYSVTGGLKFELPANWSGDFSVTNSANRQSTVSPTTTYTTQAVSTQYTKAYNELTSLDLNVSGAAFSLPSGDVKVAVGGGYRWEDGSLSTLIDTFGTAWSANRRVGYLFGETNIPLVTEDPSRTGLHSLNFDASGRYENYSNSFSSAVPKVALVYVPFDSLTLKASWGESFRAPTLDELHSGGGAGLYSAALFGINTPNATVIYAAGSNPNLQPETSKNWTATADFAPSQIPGLTTEFSAFGIDYTNRIIFPVIGVTSALRTPVDAPYVTYSPSAQLQQQIIATGGALSNFSGGAYNPANVFALVNNFATNAQSQQANGFDLRVNYAFTTSIGSFLAGLDATWLDLKQKNSPLSPTQKLTGTIFEAPKFKLRSTINWSLGALSAGLALNYIDGEQDNVAVTPADIGSWTTVDFNFSYRLDEFKSIFQGLLLNFNIQNIADTAPPHVNPADYLRLGYGYDTANASPFGRMFGITLTKTW